VSIAVAVGGCGQNNCPAGGGPSLAAMPSQVSSAARPARGPPAGLITSFNRVRDSQLRGD
jgi:hypothetical protein